MKYILFDLDGTIIDSFEGISKSFIYALKHFGIDEKAENLRRVVGPPLTYSFSRFYNFQGEQLERAILYYRERYKCDGVRECSLYDGVKECLKSLKEGGFVLALATSKPEKFAKMILQDKEIFDYFSVVVGSGLDGSLDTKKDVIEEALKRLGSPERDECVMVGDRIHDVEGAKMCSVKTIGVSYGFCPDVNEEMKDAIAVASSPEELLKICMSMK